MTIVLSEAINELVQQRLATGRYSSVDDLLQKALRHLGSEEQLLDHLRASAEEHVAGKAIAFEDFEREVRTSRGWS